MQERQTSGKFFVSRVAPIFISFGCHTRETSFYLHTLSSFAKTKAKYFNRINIGIKHGFHALSFARSRGSVENRG